MEIDFNGKLTTWKSTPKYSTAKKNFILKKYKLHLVISKIIYKVEAQLSPNEIVCKRNESAKSFEILKLNQYSNKESFQSK